MPDRPASPGPDPAHDAGPHDERLGVPWWWWPPVLFMAGLLAAEAHMGYPGIRAWLPYVIVIPLAVAALLWLGRVRVGAGPADGSGEVEVRAERAHIPARLVGRVDIVSGEAKRRALGPELDPTAFVMHRPWVGPAVRLEVLDPDDPTPYWVVSTRHPDRLVAALRHPATDR